MVYLVGGSDGHSRRLRSMLRYDPDADRCERRQVDPEVGPTSAFYSCIPTGMHGPNYILWANLTTFSPQLDRAPGADGRAPRGASSGRGTRHL
jgi:hypothetical protein